MKARSEKESTTEGMLWRASGFSGLSTEVKTLLTLIKEWIAPGTIIVLDGWKVYANLLKHRYIQLIIRLNLSTRKVFTRTRSKATGGK